MLNIKPHNQGGTLLMDVRITAVVGAGTDMYGNPYYCVLTENDGEFRTMIGAAVNYGITNYQVRPDSEDDAPLLCLELTKNGRIRYITPMPELSSKYGPQES